MKANEKILCVDDEPNVLDSLRRTLRKQFALDTALGGEEALKAIRERGPYAVIVSDMRMPEMDGVELLARVGEIAPETVRMMLTGNADQQTAVDAINTGHIFRFMNKPCSPEQFAAAVEAGLKQYRLIRAEKELLENTLRGSVKVLGDVLSLVNPAAFGRAMRVRKLAAQIARALGVEEIWQVEVAAILSQIGCVTVPQEILDKIYHGRYPSARECRIYRDHARIGADLIGRIPRMEEVSAIIKFQEKRYDGTGWPEEPCAGEELPLGARILKVALDMDVLSNGDCEPTQAIEQLERRSGWYDAKVLEALRRVIASMPKKRNKSINIYEVQAGMILNEPIKSANGVMYLDRGQEITESMAMRLKNLVHSGAIQAVDSIDVLIDMAKHETGDEKKEGEGEGSGASAPEPTDPADETPSNKYIACHAPSEEDAAKALTQTLRQEVCVQEIPSWQIDQEDRTAVAVYAGEGGAVGAVAIGDMNFVGYAGGAFSSLLPAALAEQIRTGHFSDSVRGSLCEIMNALTRLLDPEGKAGLRLHTIHLPDEPVIEKAHAVLDNPTDRLDLEVTILKYGTGKLSILTL